MRILGLCKARLSGEVDAQGKHCWQAIRNTAEEPPMERSCATWRMNSEKVERRYRGKQEKE
jgi:hypothetical protein